MKKDPKHLLIAAARAGYEEWRKGTIVGMVPPWGKAPLHVRKRWLSIAAKTLDAMIEETG